MLQCVRGTVGGSLIDVHVIPGSLGGCFSYDPWERRLRLRLSSPAVKGRANKEIVSVFCSLFGNCGLVKGQRSRKKTLFIEGKCPSLVEEVLVSVIK